MRVLTVEKMILVYHLPKKIALKFLFVESLEKMKKNEKNNNNILYNNK